MSMLSAKQRRYREVFLRKLMELLPSFLLNKLELSDDGNSTFGSLLDMSESTVNTVSAGASLLGVAGPPGMIAAGAVITILQTGNAVSKIVRRNANNKEQYSPDETRYDEFYLTYQLLFRECAQLFAMRYGLFINEALEEKGIDELAHYGAERVMKKLVDDFQTNQKTTLTVEDIFDYLLESTHISNSPRKIPAKAEFFPPSFFYPSEAVAKWVYSRARIAVPIEVAKGKWDYIFYRSVKTEREILTPESTLGKYGCVNIPAQKINYIPEPRLGHRILKPLQLTPQAATAHKQHFLSYYAVSREEVVQYLKFIQPQLEKQELPLSLNDYLTQNLGIRVIAECHDVTLQGLSLVGANFNEVNFRNAKLQGCDLNNTYWKEAHIEYAEFEANNLKNTHFNETFLEKSQWKNIYFGNDSDFSHARMKGCKLINSTISSGWPHYGAELELGEWENVQTEDPKQLFEGRLQEELTQEYNARIKADQDLLELVKHCDTYVKNIVAASEEQIQLEAQQLGELRDKIKNLETLHSNSNMRLGYEFNDVKKQYEVFQALSSQNDQEHSAAIEQLQKWRTIQEERLTRIENQEIESLLKSLQQHWKILFNSSDFLRIKSEYIERNCTPFDSSQTQIAIWDRLEQFINSPTENYFLLLGEVFDGNTSTALKWLEELIHREWLVMYFKVRQPSILMEMKNLLDSAQITALMENFRPFLIIDIEDGEAILQERILEEWELLKPEWKKGVPKILINAKTKILKYNIFELLKISSRQLFPKESIYTLALFTDTQIQDYVKIYEKSYSGFLNIFNYQVAANKDLQSLIKAPFKLHIVCQILLNVLEDEVIEANDFFTNKAEFYESFYAIWNKLALKKVAVKDLKTEDLEWYAGRLAFNMAKNQEVIDISSKNNRPKLQEMYESITQKNNQDVTVCLLEHPILRKVSDVTPLATTLLLEDRARTLRYRFSPEILGQAALANYLVKVLLDKTLKITQKIEEWNGFFLTERMGVLQLIKDRLLNERIAFKDNLLVMIYSSQGKNGEKNQQAASNAISVLNLLGVNLAKEMNQNNNKGLHIPCAYLVKAAINGLDLSRSDISRSYVWQADMTGTSFVGAKLDEIQYGSPVAFMSTEFVPHVFAVHPTLNYLAYDTEQQLYFRRFGIAIAHILDGVHSAPVMQLEGHKRKISCLTWANKEPRLASGGAGTIHIWHIPSKQESKFHAHQADVVDLIWSDNDEFLLSVSKNDNVQIRNMKDQVCIFNANHQYHQLQKVLWAQKRNILITAEREQTLSFWQLNQARNSVALIEKREEKFRNDTISGITASPDESAIASGWSSGLIRIHFLENHTLIGLQGHDDAITVVIWNEQYLVSASRDKTIRIWDGVKQHCLKMLKTNDDEINPVVWLSNKRDLIWNHKSASNAGFCIWNTSQETTPTNSEPYEIKAKNCNVAEALGLTPFHKLLFQRNGAIEINLPQNNVVLPGNESGNSLSLNASHSSQFTLSSNSQDERMRVYPTSSTPELIFNTP